jgi:hypothetical protein
LPNKLGTFVSTQTGGPGLCERVATPSSPAAGGGQAGGGGGGSANTSACPDRVPPVSRARRRDLHANRRGVRLKGRSHDPGCTSSNTISGAGHVERVDVSIAKVRGKGAGVNCRFLQKNGKLTQSRRCRRPVLLPAKGLTRWSFKLSAKLPRGHYRAVVRGVDRARNKERPAKGRNIVLFDVR